MVVSVIIPARNEQYLERTIRDVLANARGEIEVIVLLDGYLPDPQINIGDQRVIFYPFAESIGQRAAINFGVSKARGEFIMKLDAHCAVDEGFDVKLAADCEPHWTVVPRMYNLDVATWKPKLHKRTDYMYIGLRDNGELRTEYYTGEEYRKQHRKPDPIDDTMSCMGPGFFLRKERFLELGGCDENHGGWGQQGIEVACKAWLSGGRLVVNKKTWFAHWFRGGEGPGFPYRLSGREVDAARKYSKDLWLNDKWPQAKRKFQWLLDKFNPPGWKDDMPKTDFTAIYRDIRRTFNVITRNDFSPIGTHQGTRESLAGIFEHAGYKVGAEIGVWRGYFSHHILTNTSAVHLHSIDPWTEYADSKYRQPGHDRNYHKALMMLQPFIDSGRCTIHKDFSLNVVDKFSDKSLDFVYIDGAHSFDACAMDLIKWVPKVRVGGIVGLHDYFPMRQGGVVEAVDAYTRCHLIHPWFCIREAIPTVFWVKEF